MCPVSRQACRVSVRDGDGVVHVAEVEAESVYEAAVRALKAFKQARWTDGLGPAARLSIEILSPTVRHEVTVQQVNRWLASGGANPNEQVRKKELKAVLHGS